MSNISPNSLFHFTPKLDYLISIFKTGFQPRYFHEELLLNDSKPIRGHSIGIPMICFCDISLSQINNHIKFYGSYGIGMKKEWAIRNRLNPIIYMNKDSLVADPMSMLAVSGIKLNKLGNTEAKRIGADVLSSWMILQMYSKPYFGSFNHRGKSYANKKFYDEREWRYIPTKENNSLPFGGMSVEKMADSEELMKENKRLQSYSLQFTPEDVKYIFVKEENQIHKIVNELRKIKSQDYNSKMIDILTSKILTTRNIKEDL